MGDTFFKVLAGCPNTGILNPRAISKMSAITALAVGPAPAPAPVAPKEPQAEPAACYPVRHYDMGKVSALVKAALSAK